MIRIYIDKTSDISSYQHFAKRITIGIKTDYTHISFAHELCHHLDIKSFEHPPIHWWSMTPIPADVFIQEVKCWIFAVSQICDDNKEECLEFIRGKLKGYINHTSDKEVKKVIKILQGWK